MTVKHGLRQCHKQEMGLVCETADVSTLRLGKPTLEYVLGKDLNEEPVKVIVRCNRGTLGVWTVL